MSFFRKILNIFPSHIIYLLILLYFSLIFIAFLEMIGIGAIPIFLTVLFDPDPSKKIFGIETSLILNFFDDKKNLYIYFSIFIISFYFIKAIFVHLLNYFELNIIKKIKIEISKQLFSSYMYKPYIFFVNQNSSVLSKNVSHEIQYAADYINSSITLFKEITLMILIFFLLFLFDPKVTSLSFLSLFVIFLVFYIGTNKFLRKSAANRMKSLTDLFKILNLSFGSIKDIKIYKKENFFVNQFNKSQYTHEKNLMNKFLVSRLPKVIFELSGVVLFMSIILFYVLSGKDLIDLIPTLSLLAISVIRLMPAFSSISSATAFLRSWKNSFNLVYEEISQKVYDKQNSIQIFEADEDSLDKKILKIDNVNFSYLKEKNKSIIQDLNLEIAKNEMVGIIGKSGSGKSTIVNIILNLLSPEKGNVKLFKETNKKNSVKNYFGYVPQDIFLIDDTIRQNIAFGELDKDIDDVLVLDCLLKSGLKEFVDSSPNKLNTMVGEKGIKISGGERQRLGIARALYKQPKILIMDEATSSLDQNTEKKVINSIKKIKENHTIVMIAHRLSTLENCDKVYLIENGKIVDNGKLNELVKRHPNLR